MPIVIKKIINTYVKNRHQDEVFIDCVSRIGLEPFKEEVYGKKEKSV
jgi:sulfite reductase (NADPH) hemoprotein beta-component